MHKGRGVLVSVQGVSIWGEGGSVSRGFSVGGALCPGGSLSGGSVSRGFSVWGGLCPVGSLSVGVSV